MIVIFPHDLYHVYHTCTYYAVVVVIFKFYYNLSYIGTCLRILYGKSNEIKSKFIDFFLILCILLLYSSLAIE